MPPGQARIRVESPWNMEALLGRVAGPLPHRYRPDGATGDPNSPGNLPWAGELLGVTQPGRE